MMYSADRLRFLRFVQRVPSRLAILLFTAAIAARAEPRCVDYGANPAPPRLLASIDIPNVSDTRFAIAGQTLLFPAELFGMWVLNVSDLSSPRWQLAGCCLGGPGYCALCSTYLVAAAGSVPVRIGWSTQCQSTVPCFTAQTMEVGGRVVGLSHLPDAITANESWILLSGSSGIDIVDVASLSILGHLNARVVGSGEIVDRRAYLAAGNAGLLIIDFTEPSSPRILATLDTPGSALDVLVQDTYAYVADSEAGLQIVDVSDPTRPTIVGHDAGWASSVARSGSHLIVGGSGIRIFDSSNPGHPILLANWCYSAAWVETRGGLLFAASGYSVLVFDISTIPMQVVFPPMEWAPISGNGILLSQRQWAAVTTASGFSVIDVSDPQAIRLLSRVSIPSSVKSITLDGDFAYIMSPEGLRVVDLQDPTHPMARGTLPGLGYSFSVSNGIAVSTDYRDLRVIDVSDPDLPRVVSTLPISSFKTVGYRSGYAYAVSGPETHVLDLRRPDAPATLKYLPIPEDYALYRMKFIGDSLFTSGPSGLGVIDVSDPAAPVVRAKAPGLDIPPPRAGRYGYSTNGGLTVLDLQDLLHPLVIGRLCAGISACEVVGGMVVGVGSQGLTTLALQCDGPTAVAISDLTARIEGGVACLSWRAEPGAFASFNVLRQPDGAREQDWDTLSGQPVHDGSRWEYLDAEIQLGMTYSYRVLARTPQGEFFGAGPIRIATGPAMAGLQLLAWPNPSRDAVQLFVDLPRRGILDVQIFEVSGRWVRSLVRAPRDAGRSILPWDGCNGRGRSVAPGIYFVRASWPGGGASARIVRLR